MLTKRAEDVTVTLQNNGVERGYLVHSMEMKHISIDVIEAPADWDLKARYDDSNLVIKVSRGVIQVEVANQEPEMVGANGFIFVSAGTEHTITAIESCMFHLIFSKVPPAPFEQSFPTAMLAKRPKNAHTMPYPDGSTRGFIVHCKEAHAFIDIIEAPAEMVLEQEQDERSNVVIAISQGVIQVKVADKNPETVGANGFVLIPAGMKYEITVIESCMLHFINTNVYPPPPPRPLSEQAQKMMDNRLIRIT